MWRSILLVWRLLRQNWRRTLFIWRLIGNIGRQTSESRRQVMSLEVVQLTLEARKALLLGRRGLGDLLVASRRTVQRWDSCPPAAMTGALRPPSPPAHLTDAAVCAAAEGLNAPPTPLVQQIAQCEGGDTLGRSQGARAWRSRGQSTRSGRCNGAGRPDNSRRSANEESRHAVITRKLARRFGAVPDDARFGPTPRVRPLEDIAVENAAEGCVRETYGAAVCWWQAERARDPSIARAMVRIAREETSHAQLSWDLAAWAEPRLTRAARTRVAHARSRAFEELCIDVDRDVPPVLVMLAGLPPRASARELLRRVGRDVIAARAA